MPASKGKDEGLGKRAISSMVLRCCGCIAGMFRSCVSYSMPGRYCVRGLPSSSNLQCIKPEKASHSARTRQMARECQGAPMVWVAIATMYKHVNNVATDCSILKSEAHGTLDHDWNEQPGGFPKGVCAPKRTQQSCKGRQNRPRSKVGISTSSLVLGLDSIICWME